MIFFIILIYSFIFKAVDTNFLHDVGPTSAAEGVNIFKTRFDSEASGLVGEKTPDDSSDIDFGILSIEAASGANVYFDNSKRVFMLDINGTIVLLKHLDRQIVLYNMDFYNETTLLINDSLPYLIDLELTFDILQVAIDEDFLWIIIGSYKNSFMVVYRTSVRPFCCQSTEIQAIQLSGGLLFVRLLSLDLQNFLIIKSTNDVNDEDELVVYKLEGKFFVQSSNDGASAIPNGKTAHFQSDEDHYLCVVSGEDEKIYLFRVFYNGSAGSEVLNIRSLERFYANSTRFQFYDFDNQRLFTLNVRGYLVSVDIKSNASRDFQVISPSEIGVTTTIDKENNIALTLSNQSIEIFSAYSNGIRYHGYIGLDRLSPSDECERIMQLTVLPWNHSTIVKYSCLQSGMKTEQFAIIKYSRNLANSGGGTASFTDFGTFSATSAVSTDKPLEFSIEMCKENLRLRRQMNYNTFSRIKYEPSRFERKAKMIKDLRTKVQELRARYHAIQAVIPNLLSFTSNQVITGEISTNRLTVGKGTIFNIDMDNLNDIPREDYISKFLLYKGNQEIETEVRFDKVVTTKIRVDNIYHDGKIVDPEEFVLKSVASQNISGFYTFSTLEVYGDVHNTGSQPMIINDISTGDFIRKGSNVNFTGRKRFLEVLQSSRDLTVDYVNRINYKDWSDSVITKNAPYVTFPSYVRVLGNVSVDGDVKTDSINGFDLAELDQSTIKRNHNERQIVETPVIFDSPLNITNAQIKEMNGTLWSDVLRKENSTVKANIYIEKAAIMGNLESNNINGLDLSQDAVLTNKKQVIQGKITFTDDVNVTGQNGVTMDKRVTLNDCDPSLQKLQLGLGDWVVNNDVTFGDVHTTGSIYVKTVNENKFPDFKNKYWRKSISQRIEADVEISKATFKKGLYTSTLNGEQIMKYMMSGVDQKITGYNYFSKSVEVSGDVNVADGVKLSNIDISELRDNAVYTNGRQVIVDTKSFPNLYAKHLHVPGEVLNDVQVDELWYSDRDSVAENIAFKGEINCRKLITSGSLNIEYINGLLASEVIQPIIQPISELRGNLFIDNLIVNDTTIGGNLNSVNIDDWFASAISAESKYRQHINRNLTIKGKVAFQNNVGFGSVNGRDWEDYMLKIVRPCPGCIITGKKTFKYIRVLGNLNSGLINNVDLNELLPMVMTTNTEQNITGSFSFHKDLIINHTITTPEISGYPIEKLLLTDSLDHNKASGKISFSTGVSLENITADHNWLDGCNLDVALSSTPFHQDNLNSDMSLGHLHVVGDITSSETLSINRGKVDLIEALDKVVTKSGSQDITGSVQFEDYVFINSLEVNHINNENVDGILERVSGVRQDEVLHCDLEFENELTIGNALVHVVNSSNGWDLRLNNLNINDVKKHGVEKYSEEVIYGHKSFTDSVEIERNLEVDVINGVSMEDLYKPGEDNGNAVFVFNNHVEIGGMLIVRESFNDLTSSELTQYLKFIIEEDYLQYPKLINLLEIRGDLNVESINGVALRDIVLREKDKQIISGKKEFLGGIFINGRAHIDKFNDVEMEKLSAWGNWKEPGMKLTQMNTLEDFHSDLAQLHTLASNETTAMLERTVITMRAINHKNLDYAKSLHTALIGLYEVSSVDVPNAVRLHVVDWMRGHKPIMVITNPSCHEHGYCPYVGQCLSDQCPCLNTQRFQVEDNMTVSKTDDILNGLHLSLGSLNLGEWLSISLLCGSDKLSYNVGNYIESSSTRTDVKLKGLAKAGQFRTLSKTYIYVWGLDGESNLNFVKVLEVKPSHLPEVWSVEFNETVSDVEISEIDSEWLLVICFAEEDKKGEPWHTLLYKWNTQLAKFVENHVLPAATGITISTLGIDHFLILSQDHHANSYRRSYGSSDGDVLVFHKSFGDDFIPFASLPVYGPSSTVAFTLHGELFIIVASTDQDILSVYRWIQIEGFEEVQRLSVAKPTSLVHVETLEMKHFVIVISNWETVKLLQMQFGGVTFEDYR